MGRRKNTILTLTNRENKMFQGMSKFHKITADVAYQNLGINQKRLDRLEKEGYIERHTSLTEKTVYYTLTSQAKDYVKKNNDNVEHFYKGTSLKHDIEIAKFYFNLKPEQQDLAMTDMDTKREFCFVSEGGLPDMYIPKMKITIDNEVIETPNIAFEVITDSYSIAKIEEKAIYVQTLRTILKEEIVYEQVDTRQRH